MRPLAGLLYLLLFSSLAQAESEAEARAAWIAGRKAAEKHIPATIRKYAEAIGCNFAMDPKNLLPYQLDGKAGFVALFLLDVGCSGGSTMSRPVLVFLQHSGLNKVVIDVLYSNPLQTSEEFPSMVTRIYLKKGKLYFQGFELRPEDALCCPSLKVGGRVEFRKQQWRIVH